MFKDYIIYGLKYYFSEIIIKGLYNIVKLNLKIKLKMCGVYYCF